MTYSLISIYQTYSKEKQQKGSTKNQLIIFGNLRKGGGRSNNNKTNGFFIIILTIAGMNSRQQMKAIKEQKQKEQSSFNALQSQSEIQNNVSIQEYDNLEFSDEVSRIDKDEVSSDEAELSAEKLKYLGVDKFPGHYGHKLTDISDTRIGDSVTNNPLAFKQGGQSYQREGNSRKREYSTRNQPAFNVDSFLNSRPSCYQSGDRQKHNTNAFRKVLQEHKLSRVSLPNKQYQGVKHNRFNYEEKNQEVRDFIVNYGKKNGGNKQFHQEDSKISSISSQSITLITLPQPEESNLKRRPKNQIGLQPGMHQFQDHTRAAKLQQIRFEQARINFMDNFLPESMKIGSNPYNLLRYMNSKVRGIQRML